MPGRHRNPPTPGRTETIRVYRSLGQTLAEIARLERISTAALCERLFCKAAEKELEAARRRELNRLAAVTAG